jgi:hypothetical protein
MFSLSTANISEKWEIVDFAARKLKKERRADVAPLFL